MALSRDTSGSRSPQASTSYPRHEEARPFPLMAPSPPPFTSPSSTSPTPSRDDSCERDASANFSERDSSELSPAGVSGVPVHPGEGGIFSFNNTEGGPVRLTNLTPISPTNEDVYSSAELRNNPQPPISVCVPKSDFFNCSSEFFSAGAFALPTCCWLPFPLHRPRPANILHAGEREIQKTDAEETKTVTNIVNVW